MVETQRRGKESKQEIEIKERESGKRYLRYTETEE